MRWLLLGSVLVGLGFNIKMLEAYLAAPALWLMYLVASRSRLFARIGHLAVATVAMLAVSFSWATVVQLTPASERPYIGSSQTNSVFELAFGYNGLQRLFGNAFGRGSSSTDVSVSTLLSNTNTGGVGGVSENGPKGLLRLIDTQLGGQIGWLIPLAIVGLLAAVWVCDRAGSASGATWPPGRGRSAASPPRLARPLGHLVPDDGRLLQRRGLLPSLLPDHARPGRRRARRPRRRGALAATGAARSRRLARPGAPGSARRHGGGASPHPPRLSHLERATTLPILGLSIAAAVIMVATRFLRLSARSAWVKHRSASPWWWDWRRCC
ncbi:MAG: hypothetical protein U0232_24330 [Thermomicrobiales bacterium]